MGRRGLWGLLLYLRRSRRASRRREQGHRGLQGEEGNPLSYGVSKGTLGALPRSWCPLGAGPWEPSEHKATVVPALRQITLGREGPGRGRPAPRAPPTRMGPPWASFLPPSSPSFPALCSLHLVLQGQRRKASMLTPSPKPWPCPSHAGMASFSLRSLWSRLCELTPHTCPRAHTCRLQVVRRTRGQPRAAWWSRWPARAEAG